MKNKKVMGLVFGLIKSHQSHIDLMRPFPWEGMKEALFTFVTCYYSNTYKIVIT